MRLVRKMFIVSLFLSLFSQFAQAAPGNLNIAVVDVSIFQQQFMDEVNTKLQLDFKDRQAELEKMVSKFRADEAKLQKEARIMTAKKVDELKGSLIKQQSDLQAEAKKYEEDIVLKRQEMLKVKLDNLIKVVSSLSSANQYDMVLAKNIALFVDPKYDITEQVVNNYKQLGSKTAAQQPASASVPAPAVADKQ